MTLRRSAQGFTLENEVLSLSFNEGNGTITQFELLNQGLRLIREAVGEKPPWRLYFFDLKTLERKTVDDFETFSYKIIQTSELGEEFELHWQVREGLEIISRIVLPVDSANVLFHVNVHNKTQETLQQLEFPILRGIERLVESSPEANCLLHTAAAGLLFIDPLVTFSDWELPGLRHTPYPEGIGAFAQFMAYYAEDVGGFYFACHDPFNTAKEIDFYLPSQEEGLVALFAHKSWEMVPGNSLELEYPIVLGTLTEGNWYEAAECYRDWATGVGDGHPDWCRFGRLEDRVREGKAARWLAEEVGFCTFGMPSSFDVSPWLEAIHKIADKPVFHVLGHDWPQWGGSCLERMERLDDAFKEAGLKPFHEHSLNELWFPIAVQPTEAIGTTEGLKSFWSLVGAEWDTLPESRWREIFEEWNQSGPWLPVNTAPFRWFPTRFHPANLRAIRENGDFFAPFFFDFFAYGLDFDRYGQNQGDPSGWQQPHELIQAAFTKIWMDPTTDYWKEFHADRDRQIVAESSADGLYYDISAGAGPRWSDREDHGHPPGYGRWLWNGYEDLFQKSKAAANGEKGSYVAQGTEMGLENLINVIDFCQWRAGGLVQGDIELMPFMGLIKQQKAIKLPLFSYLFHEYGPVMLDGWAKLSSEFGDIFYLIAAQIALQQGGLVELNYEYSPLERFPGMQGPTYQLMYHNAIYQENDPFGVDTQKIDFLREIALARTEFATEYLAYGKAMKPVRLLTPVPEVDFLWNHYNSIGGRRESGAFRASSLVQQVWSYTSEKLGVLMVNLNEESPLDVKFAFSPEGYGLEATGFDAKVVTCDEIYVLDIQQIDDEWQISLQLPPRKIVLVEITPVKG